MTHQDRTGRGSGSGGRGKSPQGGQRRPRDQQLAPDIPPHRLRTRTFTNAPASPLGGYAALNIALVRELPLPVAHAAERVAAERSPEGQLDRIVDAFRCGTRFLALVALAQYLRDPARDPAVGGKLRGFLSQHPMPDGLWVSIVREALRPYAGRPQRAALADLVAFYFHPESGRVTPEAREFEGWVEFRNRRSHPEVPERRQPGDEPSRAVAPVSPERLAEEWLAALALFVQDTAFFQEYELLQPLQVSLNPPTIRSARVFRGPSLSARYVREMSVPITAEGLEPEESVVLVRVSRPHEQLTVSPFLIVGEGGTLLALRTIAQQQGRIVGAQYVDAATTRDARSLSEERHGARHLEELTRLVAPLGAVGVVAEAEKLLLHRYRVGEDPWRAVERWANAWVQAGYSYDLLLEFDRENDLKAAIGNPDLWRSAGTREVEAFVLLLALHYRLSWLRWAETNAGNELAAMQVLQMLGTANRYHRPRLRGLYALQLFRREVIEQVLAEGDWPSQNVELVRRYVMSGRVKEYLGYLATSTATYPLPQRAGEVMAEIEPTGAGGIDLPPGPGDGTALDNSGKE